MKTALITGASSGVGADAARHLSARGYRVLLVARGEAALQRVAESIGGSAAVEVCDASSAEAVAALAERVRHAYGVPDVIVNCAGAGQWKLIEDTACEEALAMMQAPYLAAFNMSHAFMRDMLARRSGVIIHVNSPASIFPWPSCVGYAAARWALRGLHMSLRQDLAGTGVTSCHVVFGRVDSAYFDHNPGVGREDPLDLPHHTDLVHGRVRSRDRRPRGEAAARAAVSLDAPRVRVDLSPDTRTRALAAEGHRGKTPLTRHRQPYGLVVAAQGPHAVGTAEVADVSRPEDDADGADRRSDPTRPRSPRSPSSLRSRSAAPPPVSSAT